MKTASLIQNRLQTSLDAATVLVTDESHLHRGHVGAMGGGHYHVTVVSARFEGQSPVQRHRLVYQALQDQMAGTIHALAIAAYTPDQWLAIAPTTDPEASPNI